MGISKIITSFDGAKLRYIEYNSPNHVGWIILLHGLGGDAQAWKEIQKTMSENGYSSIALDFRGHGASDDPIRIDDCTIDCFVKDVDFLVSKLGIKSAILVGHCFGGVVSIDCACSRFNWLKKLVVVSSTYMSPIPFLSIKIKRLFSDILKRFVYMFPAGRKYYNRNYRPYVGTGDYNIFRLISDIRSTDWRSYFLVLLNMLTFDIGDKIKMVDLPTLIVCGEKDRVFSTKVSKRINEKINKSKLVILPNDNHVLLLNDPRGLSNEIKNFLR